MVLKGALNLRRDREVREKNAASSQAPACAGAATVRCRREEHCRGRKRQGHETRGVHHIHEAGGANPERKGQPDPRPGACRGNSS